MSDLHEDARRDMTDMCVLARRVLCIWYLLACSHEDGDSGDVPHAEVPLSVSRCALRCRHINVPSAHTNKVDEPVIDVWPARNTGVPAGATALRDAEELRHGGVVFATYDYLRAGLDSGNLIETIRGRECALAYPVAIANQYIRLHASLKSLLTSGCLSCISLAPRPRRPPACDCQTYSSADPSACSRSADARTQSEIATELMTEALLEPNARCRQIADWLKVRSPQAHADKFCNSAACACRPACKQAHHDIRKNE